MDILVLGIFIVLFFALVAISIKLTMIDEEVARIKNKQLKTYEGVKND